MYIYNIAIASFNVNNHLYTTLQRCPIPCSPANHIRNHKKHLSSHQTTQQFRLKRQQRTHRTLLPRSRHLRRRRRILLRGNYQSTRSYQNINDDGCYQCLRWIGRGMCVENCEGRGRGWIVCGSGSASGVYCSERLYLFCDV